MLRLLVDPKTDGYPLDFLLVRLRGRRQRWPDLTGKHQRKSIDPWPARQAELCWLFKTMDRKTRQEFGPCFLQFELRRLLIGLRRLAGRNQDGIDRLAEQPLLNRKLVRRLQTALDVTDAVRILDAAISDDSHTASRLEQTLTNQGHRQMEEKLIDLFFQSVSARPKRPPLRSYFGQLIDLQNLLTILKTRRWQIPESRPLLGGGTLTPRQWQSLQRPGQELKLRQTIERISGSESFDAESVEHALLGRIQRRLHRQARTDPESFLLLDYLWAHDLHTRNLGLQRWTGDKLAAWEKLG